MLVSEALNFSRRKFFCRAWPNRIMAERMGRLPEIGNVTDPAGGDP
jgi:hypothetical protein